MRRYDFADVGKNPHAQIVSPVVDDRAHAVCVRPCRNRFEEVAGKQFTAVLKSRGQDVRDGPLENMRRVEDGGVFGPVNQVFDNWLSKSENMRTCGCVRSLSCGGRRRIFGPTSSGRRRCAGVHPAAPIENCSSHRRPVGRQCRVRPPPR